MPVLQNLYQIFKFSSTFVIDHNCDIKNYSQGDGMRENNIISIGDNLVFDQIRHYYNDTRSPRKIFYDTQVIRKKIHEYKKEGKHAEARVLNRRLVDFLFVKDIVNVFVDKKSHYKDIGKKGFYLNGNHYIRFCCGSGQMRRNTITFINEKLYKSITDNLMCGFMSKTKDFNLAKLHAYFALSFSSVLWVRTPRVCVIKDFFNPIDPNEKIDFIEKDPKTGKKIIVQKTAGQLRLELNCADGQGLVDPQFAQLWGQDMNLSYCPCSFVVRSVFIKGNLATFDFKKYAREHGITTIRDKWGVTYNVEDIDVLLSESQFKMHKYYTNWQEYLSYTEKAGIRWGVARYNKKYDDDYVLANYQYIQALTITKEDIQKLIAPTIDWIRKICSGDDLYTLLYMYGVKNEDADYQAMYSSAQSLTAKAIVKNSDFLKDTYVQQKIYKNIAESINKAKLGKIWLHGNYQFMISDPYAQCQAAFGQKPTGLLKTGEIYSGWWKDKVADKTTIDCCRSPMIDQHEHNPMTFHCNELMEEWYQYLPSGVIFNIYDTSVYRAEDADFDGDIILTTDNEVFIKGSNKNQNTITYEKGAAPTQKINLNNSVKTDLRGLGTGVGGFSNLATTMYAMIEQFDPEKQADQRAELKHRIKLLREIVGQEIDRIKGTAAPVVPADWKKLEKILPEDTDAEKAEKYKHNSMVISKKPYFFRYLYPELNQQFKQYESSYNQMSVSTFGLKLKQLLAKQNKTDAEKKMVRMYQKYSPLITSNCTMNTLCREFEDADFEINFRKDNVSMLPTFEHEFTFDQSKLQLVKSQYQKYSSSKQINVLNHFFDYDENYLTSQKTNDFKTIKFKIADSVCHDIREYLISSGVTPAEILYYCNELSRQYKKFNWAFAWDVLDTQILAFIPQGRTKAPVNIKDLAPGEFVSDPQFKDAETGEYLGQTYVLKDVTKDYWQAQKNEYEKEKQLSEIQQRVEILEEQTPQTEEERERTEEEIADLVEQFIMTATSTVPPKSEEEKKIEEAKAEEEAKEKPVYTGDEEWKNYADDVSNLSILGDRFSEWWDLYRDVDENGVNKEDINSKNGQKNKGQKRK